MSHASRDHVRNLVPDSGGNGHVRRLRTARLSGVLVSFGRGRYLIPAVARGDT
jgi:hypothetical protein